MADCFALDGTVISAMWWSTDRPSVDANWGTLFQKVALFEERKKERKKEERKNKYM